MQSFRFSIHIRTTTLRRCNAPMPRALCGLREDAFQLQVLSTLHGLLLQVLSILHRLLRWSRTASVAVLRDQRNALPVATAPFSALHLSQFEL